MARTDTHRTGSRLPRARHPSRPAFLVAGICALLCCFAAVPSASAQAPTAADKGLQVEVDREGRKVLLGWTLPAEPTVVRYVVERSVDDERHFAEVAVRAVADSLTGGHAFRVVDRALPEGVESVQYRLRTESAHASPHTTEPVTASFEDGTPAHLLGVYPNPLRSNGTVQFELYRPGPVNVSIYNVLGQRVLTVTSGQQSAGRSEAHFNVADLPGGLYFVRLQSGSFSQTRRITVVR